MSRISFKGVIVGGIVDIGATNVVTIPLIAIVAMQVNIAEIPKAEQTQLLMSTMRNSPSFFLAGILLGSLCSVLGGYVAARIAKSDALLNAALSSWLCVAFGVYSLFGKSSFLSSAQHV